MAGEIKDMLSVERIAFGHANRPGWSEVKATVQAIRDQMHFQGDVTLRVPVDKAMSLTEIEKQIVERIRHLLVPIDQRG